MNKPPSLRSRRDFQRVLRRGSRSRGAVGALITLSSPDADAPARLGLVVSGSVGGAVVRNRIKRRLRAAFVAAAPSPGIDLVVRANRGAATADFQELERSIAEAMSR